MNQKLHLPSTSISNPKMCLPAAFLPTSKRIFELLPALQSGPLRYSLAEDGDEDIWGNVGEEASGNESKAAFVFPFRFSD